jgi:diacylglycerol kinase family enzyme
VIPRPSSPVLIVNPRSGGGKAQRHDLVGQCRARTIEPVIAEDGQDISTLAETAVSRGADVIGMAGGDGSQAEVAAIAVQHDLPFVCVPAGTRNHFALDLGIDRDDIVGALDAFYDGSERRIDLARVNGRVFVNNASMGLYGAIVQSPEYRDAKLRTMIEKLPKLLGPNAQEFDLRFTDPDSSLWSGTQLLLVSNNHYELDPLGTQGTRGGIDQGTLGVVAVRFGSPFHGLREWVTPTFRVDSGSKVDVGLDGEALVLEPPLVFECLSLALRTRTAVREGLRRHPGRISGRSALVRANRQSGVPMRPMRAATRVGHMPWQ